MFSFSYGNGNMGFYRFSEEDNMLAEFLDYLDLHLIQIQNVSILIHYVCLLGVSWLWGYHEGEKNGRAR